MDIEINMDTDMDLDIDLDKNTYIDMDRYIYRHSIVAAQSRAAAGAELEQRPSLRRTMPCPISGTVYTLNDLLRYNATTLSWIPVVVAGGTPPEGRAGHCFQSIGGLIYVHGGYGNGAPCPA
jgi:hypothetical protein